jgi:membrane protein implicated in regulation of membrane protease activity
MRDPLVITGSDRLIGREAVVLSSVDAHDGRVRLNGGEWTARTADRAQVLPPGTVVRVVQIDGATAVVVLDANYGYAGETAIF